MSSAAAKTGLLNPEVFEASLVVSGADASGLGESLGATPTSSPPHTPSAASEGSGEHQPLWTGKTLSHFRLMRPLGEGAMGLVIQGQDLHLHRLVALKVLRKRIEGLDEKSRVEQFLREARAAGQLDHPNVARVYEINEHRGWWYIATELLEGGTLHDVVRAAGPLPPARACPILADAAAGLAAAHQAGMVHRDIKPSNLMLTRTGRCKVVDFGLVRLDDPNDPFDFTEQAVGTPHYMAPEVIRREAATPLADVYGLGAVLYFALTGSPPFEGKSISDVLRQHVKAERPDVRAKCPMCPESLAKLVKRAMSVEPQKRPNAATLALALRAESIGSEQANDPLALGASVGSSVLADALLQGASARSSVALGTPSDRSVTALEATAQRAWDWLPRISAAAVLAVLIGTAGWWAWRTWRGDGSVAVRPPADHEAFARRFPDAPPSYGDMPAGHVAVAPDPPPPSVASWLGQADIGSAPFVASRDGRTYFRRDDPRTGQISADQIVSFATEAEAQAQGRSPAP